MPFPIRLRPQVEDEVNEAMAWYRERRSGLEIDFYRTFLDILGLIAESPDLYRTVYGDA